MNKTARVRLDESRDERRVKDPLNIPVSNSWRLVARALFLAEANAATDLRQLLNSGEMESVIPSLREHLTITQLGMEAFGLIPIFDLDGVPLPSSEIPL